MLEDLIIILDDTSISYCHFDNPHGKRRLINRDILKAGITFAMKENLHMQLVFPDYELPVEYNEIIDTLEHSTIRSALCADRQTDVAVFDNWDEVTNYSFCPDTVYVLRTNKDDFYNHYYLIPPVLGQVKRLNVVITDIETFKEEDFVRYRQALQEIAKEIESFYRYGKKVQLNLLTDRMILDRMNNCNAGWKNITLAPNGKFYLCPAFYFQDEMNHVGDVTKGLCLKNAHLYRLAYAPLCRICDAYQCNRCVWLNKKMTLEVNIPSREQCVIAHIERNISRLLLASVQPYDTSLNRENIKEIDYLEPLDIYRK